MNSWQQNQLALQKHLKDESTSDFLNWSTIRKTMYVGGGAMQIPGEYRELRKEWDKWMPVVRWTGFGGDVYRSKNGYATDPNLIHQAYHLKQWLDKSKTNVSKLSAICEIGAGYGAMALICRRLGFSGQYFIYDLPEMVEIQKHYLGGNGIMALWELPKKSCDLFIACHSLSEMPVNEREKLLSQVETNAYLFASSYEFEGVDNQTWFHQLGGSTVGVDWLFYAHPYQENAFYQVGVKL